MLYERCIKVKRYDNKMRDSFADTSRALISPVVSGSISLYQYQRKMRDQ